jgi:hypothetical protein
LDEHEKELDDQETIMHTALKDLLDHPANAPLAYCDAKDLIELGGFADDSVVMLRGPPGTQIVFPEAQYNPDAKSSKYSVYAHSRGGPIDALLVSPIRQSAFPPI